MALQIRPRPQDESAIWRDISQSQPKPKGDSSLTTEYPANGSFFRPHTRSVHEADAVGTQGLGLRAQHTNVLLSRV